MQPAADAKACHQRALALQQKGDRQAAAALFERALAQDARFWPARFELGSLRLNGGAFEEAIRDFEAVLRLEPAHARSWLLLGVAWNGLSRADRALDCFKQALKVDPAFGEAHYNCGVIQHGQGDLEAAVASNRLAIAHPPSPLMAYSNLGIALEALGDMQGAAESYDAAISADPNDPSAYWNKALLLLRQGDDEAGWPLYEWRWAAGKAGVPVRHYTGRPLWFGGTSIEGRTILVHPEQGLGDVIQFARFVPMLAARGARVVFEVFTPLFSLFHGLPGFGEVVGMGTGLPNFDLHCPLMSLPLALDMGIETLPQDTPYILPDPERVSTWRKRLGSSRRKRIGFVWKGNPKFPGNASRLVPLEQFQAIFGTAAEFLCAQKELSAAEREILAAHKNVRLMGDDLADFGDTAALLAHCDVVITSDTSFAHLAGAMGKPTLLLLAAHADWRWLMERADSPWYPTGLLFRQAEPGAWEDVISSVRASLGEYLK